ncbi:abnormal spindle-like microcephaly-associated protein isoform X1 [Xiphias gladius]|uniref:abnormal spindle-like microcephaly-associated protein isoform X1 n=1 Tax=Xiphias gladius TaxID=8245 RepID=UPI001A97EFBF|nr:abnormal spindle-like microcephaly-associated protein isoform X1 [Xiphias gladius]
MTETVTSTRGGFLDYSPAKRGDANKENNVPVLSLIQFSKAPFVTFGTVKLGTSKSAVLRIDNPTEDAEAEVTVEKIPSSKGFSLDHNTFTIQPEGSFSLTVTWTPTEEGGIRELIVFNANGVLKHQAVLLGRAEAPKKKKKSLWDTIKNKREGEKVAAPRGKKMEPPLKMAANKTFQVSRRPQYKRDKPRSPLASLNEGKAVRERSLTKHSPADDPLRKSEEQKALNPKPRQQSLTLSDQENIQHIQRNSPVVLLVPAVKMIDSGSTSASPDAPGSKPGNKDFTKILNRTCSPVGTPERFKKLIPRIQSGSPVPDSVKSAADADDSNSELTRTPVLSLKDALALIDSDLSHIITSPQDTSSSCDFSDSLESRSGSRGCGSDRNALKALTDSPELSESNEPRLTFFVSKKGVVNEVVVSESEAGKATEMVKKASFTSATVTKSKAPVEESSLSGRKIKKSRRRLLEKTLELSDSGSQCESGPCTPKLPVIGTGAGTKGWQNPDGTGLLCDNTHGVPEFTSSSPTPRLYGSATPITFPVTSPPLMAPTRFSFSVTSPPPAAPASGAFTVASPSPLGSPSPLHPNPSSDPNVHEHSPTVSAPPCVQEDPFPIHMAVKSKKRKSEEYLKSDAKVEDVGKTDRVKRSKVLAGKIPTSRSAQERRSASQRQQQRTAGSVRSITTSSLKSRRSAVPAQAKQSSSRVPSRDAPSLKSSGASSVKTAKVVAVAQSKLTFIKPAQTAIPRHPTPFAAKNMFYDERWIEKQETGFTWWINYVLTPDDFKVNTEVAKVSAVSLTMANDDSFSVPKAPTKEEMSFSTYTARRKLNRLRRSACQLFTSEAMVKAIQRLELEVEAKRLLVRKDRHLWKDIGERRKVLSWLLSYNPLWLRIGLETIYGELISLESNSDALGLAVFILQRLLWNPDIAAAFRHPKVPHLYKDGHEEALSRFTLKKLLLLVCFLDKAKESRLIEHDPCLFCVDAEFKMSKDLLLAFSRDFLSGEGILPRHLGYLGLPVSHVQTPLDEFNFAVKNLAVDLKCGIRLVRVMELLIQDWSLSAKLRLPAISRLQKVHNVDVALQVLKSKGVDLKDEHGCAIDSRDIVDGHREKTLSLLWKIIFAFHVEAVLDEDQLREEIGFLKRTLRTKRRLVSLRADRGLQPSPAKTRVPYEHGSTKITLLMDWVRAVCDFYNLKVENFTVTFSDGRILCYLIHHYHPSLLPGEAVSHSTTQTVDCSLRGRLELSCSASDSDSSFDSLPTGLHGPDSPSVEFKELLENERNNFRLVNTAVAFLGGVPAMINPADMSNTIPNEKVVMSYLTFLCARLLDLRNETRAARVIQGAWRKYRLKKDLQLYKERNTAALKIQLVVRSFLQKRRAKRQSRAAVVIQSVWRGYVARNRLRLKKEAQLRALQHQAATVIQAQWRMFSATRAYHRLRYYTIVVQAQWRMRRAASAYGRIYRAATVLQKHSRAWALARRDRECYLSLRTAAVTLQRVYRRWKARKTKKENCAAKVIQAVFKKWYEEKMAIKTAAAVRIQSWYRMQRSLHQYRNVKRSIVLIQAQYRGHAQRRCFKMLKLQHHSAVVIQSALRGHAVRNQVAKMRCASVVIQRRFRATVKRDVERQMFVRTRHAAVTIQAAYRGQVARELLKKQRNSATVIQAAFRKYTAQRRYLVLRKAVAVIQRKYRATILARKTMKDFEALRNAALIIQATWRGRADRKRIEKQHRCATLIQAYYRRHKAQAGYRPKKAAAVVIQRHYRAYVAGKEARKAYLYERAACVTLQAGFRGMRVRTELKKKHQAATIIQSSVRMFLCRKQYFLLQSASIIIQSRYRALLLCRTQQNEYRELKLAAIKIQALYRGFRVREDLKKRHNAATSIQAQFRMHRIRMAYLATRCAAIIIQERYRAKRLRDQQLQTYKTMKTAAVAIQAAYRGHMARRTVAEMHRAATVIQRKFHTIRGRNRFLAIKAAALVCQQRYRAVNLARKDRLDYLSKRRAAICLQAAYRGHKVREQLRIQHTAAVTIQSRFRKYQQRTYYKKLYWAANVLQSRYRANKKMRDEMHTLSAKRKAAVVLQAAYRGMKSRRIVKQSHQAASVLQRAYRAYSERKQYLKLKLSVLTIQRKYRAAAAATAQRTQYLKMRRAAVVLQAAYRGRQVRKEVAGWHQAAIVIQSVFRKHREEVKFQAMRLSAIVIQRSYRALVLQRQDRENFLKRRHCAVVLQAAFRGHRVRRNIAKMHRAATVIQANFKRHKQQSAFRRQRWAAGVLQQRFRAQRQRNVEIKHYQEVRKAVIYLQATFRGMKSRRIVKQSHQAASVIQRAYRAHCEHKQYLALKSSVLTIQQRYRATVAAKEQLQKYQKMRRAAVVLQAAYRGRQVRKEVAGWHHAATVIQSVFRKHREEVKFQAMRLSAIVIQRSYRALVLQRQDRQNFLKMRHCAVVLQAAYRGRQVRKEVAGWHQAAIVIQSVFRKHREEVKFQAMRLSAIVIQRSYRALVLQRQDRENFLKRRHCAVVLQAAYRGRQVRKEVAGWHQAAIVIQSVFRKHREEVKFQAMRLSAIVIQRSYRALVLQRQDRENFLKTRHCAVVLQAAFRGHRVRNNIAKMHRAATVIQANFKRHKQQSAFRRQRWAAGVLQQRFRAQRQRNVEIKHYQNHRRAAIVLQAAYRGMKSRRIVKQSHQAASVLQRAYRAYSERKQYLKLKLSVLTIQRKYRAAAAATAQRTQYLKIRRAAVVLQAAYRGRQVRKEVAGWHQAAIVIQSVFRKHREEVKFQAMRLSAIVIQRSYRALVLQRQDRENFLKRRHCAVVLQAAFRGHRVRRNIAKMHRAATVIQANFKRHKQQSAFRRQRWAAGVLQQRFRAQRQRNVEIKHYQEVRKAVIYLQATFRGMKSRRIVKQSHQAASVLQRAYRAHCEHKQYLALKSSVLTIQQRYRATVAAKEQLQKYQKMRRAAVVLQAAYRGRQVRKEVAGWHHAATVIQSVFRKHREEVKFQAMRLSAIVIQRSYRALVLQRQDRQNFLKMRHCAVVLQAAYRGRQVRKEVAGWHQAAIVIQSVFRKHREEVKFQAMRLSAIVIQRSYRGLVLQRQERQKFLKVKQSTIILQAAFRGWCVRREISRQNQTAIVIQSRWRCLVQRRIYQRKREAAVTLQRRIRAAQLGRVERNNYTRMRQAAVTLQTHCRAWTAKRKVLEAARAERRLRFTSAIFHHLSAIRIQRALRAHWALESAKRQIHSVITIQRWARARQQRRQYLEDRRKVVVAQRAIKRWLARRHKAASVIQQAVRKFLRLRQQERVQQGIVKAQALWRGHRSRRLNDNPKVVKLRHRLREVSACVREEDRLCNKTSCALDYLLRYKHFSYILEALKNLETATRLSPECCERLVESGATNIIFTLIRCCNRSVPCMDVITFSIQILLNLSKYHKTIEAVYSVENSVETLLDLLQRYREKAGDKVAEKGGGIFTKACFLLALLLQDKHRAAEVMKLPKALDRIRSIYRLTARKQKMDAERTVIKQKINASINGSFYVQATPRKSRPAPKFAPDWVLRKDKLKDIADPLRAIQMVAHTLSIVL